MNTAQFKKLKIYLILYFFLSPQETIAGLGETFMKRHTAEGNNMAEIRQEEQSEKTESCRENLWNEIPLKGPERQK